MKIFENYESWKFKRCLHDPVAMNHIINIGWYDNFKNEYNKFRKTKFYIGLFMALATAIITFTLNI